LEKMEAYQVAELQKFLYFAKENSAFYRQLYAGIDLSLIRSVADLKMLPSVSKEDLRQNMTDVDTTATAGLQSDTGGTSGKSLTVYYTVDNAMQRMAMLDHFKARVGFIHLK